MSGPIDARIHPTAVGRFAEAQPIEWFEAALIEPVPPGLPGAGRRVYPGLVQLAAFISLDPLLHLESHLRFAAGLDAEKHRRFYDDYFAVMDVPAKFYLQTVHDVFLQHLLMRGCMVHRNMPVRPEALGRTALLTVEGEKDEIGAPGQIFAAHALCTGIPTAAARTIYTRERATTASLAVAGGARGWRRCCALLSARGALEPLPRSWLSCRAWNGQFRLDSTSASIPSTGTPPPRCPR